MYILFYYIAFTFYKHSHCTATCVLVTHFHIFFEHFPDIFTTTSRQQELCVFDTFLVTYNCRSLVILFKRHVIPTYLHCITIHYTHTNIHTYIQKNTHTFICWSPCLIRVVTPSITADVRQRQCRKYDFV